MAAFHSGECQQNNFGHVSNRRKKQRCIRIFYPNPNNEFWRLIFKVANKNLHDFKNDDSIKIRQEVLTSLKLGIADIGYRVLRQKGSSNDQNLFPIEYTDIFALLERHLKIKKIIITSSSGANSTLAWFHHFCELNNHTFPMPKERLPSKSSLKFRNRNIRIDIIASPSRVSPVKGDRLIEMYKTAILDNE